MEQQFFNTFWGGEFNYERFLWIVLLTAVAGSSLISRDLKNNTFTLYFSRPLTWVDYAIGKFMALATALSLITIVPTVLIFSTKMAFLDEPFIFVIEKLPILGGMVLSYLIAIVFFSSVAMALSSMTKRGVFAGVGIFAYLVMAPIISDLLVEIFDNDHLKLLNVNLVLKSLFIPFFGLKYSESSMGFGYHLLVLEVLALIAICWGILFFRFHNKEVAK
jgi:ABC-2 type transport system permease protein